MRDISNELQVYAEELDERMELDDPNDHDIIEFTVDLYHGKINKTLLSLGVAFVHADAISYDGKGILFVGADQSGKTTLTSKLVKDDHGKGRIKRLAEDTTVMLLSEDQELAPVLYYDDRKNTHPPFIVPFAFPHSVEELPITHIFHVQDHLDAKGITIREAALEPILNRISYDETMRETMVGHMRSFSRAKCYEIVRNKDKTQIHHLADAVRKTLND